MPVLADLLKSGIVLFDGAMGSQLIAAGMTRGDCSERWTLDRPGIIRGIHSSYIRAGAQVVTTNTFGATRYHLQKHGLDGRLAEISRNAVALAREAAGTAASVALDIGPTGAMFPPMGKADAGLISEIVAEQVLSVPLDAIDLVLIETQYDLREALAALTAVRRSSPVPVAVTMTFNRTRRGYFTMVGDSPAHCCSELEAAGAFMIGANCTLGPDDMADLAGILVESTRLPVLIQPNSGQPLVTGDTVTYPVSPGEFTAGIAGIIGRGVRAVGGCCGTGPETIEMMKIYLEKTSHV